MKKPFTLTTLLLTAVAALAQETVEPDSAVQLISPKDGETVHMPHPHFRWRKEAGADIEDRYRVQIARDETFRALVVDDSLDVVSRLVCAKPLSPGTYFWRVRREDQTRWSKISRFTRCQEFAFGGRPLEQPSGRIGGREKGGW